MREQLLSWITKIYAGRSIRLSGEPYLHHLVAVAAMVSPVLPLGYEIGLCHDLLEDTGMQPAELRRRLEKTGYRKDTAACVARAVTELTDVYTKAAFPGLPKKVRKAKEAERLLSIGADAQTVKYADLMYNAEWTVTYEPAGAPGYLGRKLRLLQHLDKGDAALRYRAIATLLNLQQKAG